MVMLKYFTGLCLLLTSLFTFAQIETSVSQSILTKNDYIQFQITFDDQVANFDYSALERDFNIHRKRGPNISSSFINGKGGTTTTFIFTLSAKRTGRISIPSITHNGDSSEPIYVNVKNSGHSITSEELFFLTASISDASAYIDQPLLLELNFHNAAEINSANLEFQQKMPFELTQLNDSPTSKKSINGVTYTVSTLYYQITPQQAGEFTIPRIKIKGQYTYNRNPRAFESQSRPINIKINPIPDEYPKNKPWLPAKSVLMKDNLNNNIELTNGDSITRTIDIQLNGLNNNYLPKLEIPNSEGIKIYSEDEIREDRIIDNINAGLIQAKWAILPTQNGQNTLPEFSITWWDVDNDRLRVTKIAPRTINVSGITTQAPTAAQTPVIINNESQSIPSWVWLSHLLLIIGWISTTLFLLLKIKNNKNRTENKKDNSISQNIKTNHHVSVKQACELKSLRKLKQALIDLEKHCTANQLNYKAYQTGLASYLNLLNKALYQSDSSNSQFDFNGFLDAFNKIKLKKEQPSEKIADQVSLYPNN